MFKYIQTFYLDSSSVKNAAEAGISKIDLYFRAKPKRTGNKSGINSPGVEVSICSVVNGIPIIDEMDSIRPTEPTEHGARFAPRYEIARAEWGEIIVTDDASIPTSFVFDSPMFVDTKKEYGILIKFDGNEDFFLWQNKVNETIVDSTLKSKGVSDRNVGVLFSYIGPSNINIDNIAPTTSTGLIQTQSNVVIPVYNADAEFVQTNWKPISDTDLKFKVYVARYFHGGVPVVSNSTILNMPEYADRFPTDNLPYSIGNNTLRIPAPCVPEEYIKFDVKDSNITTVASGDRVYQETFHWPGGKATPLTVRATAGAISIIANGSYVLSNGSTFAASNGFYNLFGGGNNEYIIVDGGTKSDVLQVSQVSNSTVILVDRPLSFSNSAAKIMLSPVAELAGISESYVDGTVSDILVLTQSNANTTARFVNNQILSITPLTGGSGYANTDYITINGFENVPGIVVGGYPAVANLTTNSTGGITNYYLTNTGCGFVNTAWVAGANVVIKNANNANSVGTGATISFTTGMNLKVHSNAQARFSNCEVLNLEASRLKPEITVNNPLGTAFAINHRTLFHSRPSTNTYSGKRYHAYANNEVTNIQVKIFKSHDAGSEQDVTSVIPSRSNQFVIPYANGTVANTTFIGNNYSNASVYLFDVSSNNDFVNPFIEPEIINSHFSKYVINNDYTDEHTNYGNAYSKHITTKVTFNNERQAEDLLVYLTAYRPAGTDLKVFARIHNRLDSDAFDDKDWTLLEEVDGVGVFSSSTDTTDFVELTYNFTNSPNTDMRLTGTGELANTTTSTITGLANTGEIAVNDLVKISQPLFAANSYAIAVVNNIINTTAFNMTGPIANNGLVGTGLIVEKISTYKHQAFNDVLNDNIVKYYNEEMVPFNTYDSFQVKVVFLSNNESLVPKVDDIRSIGVTA